MPSELGYFTIPVTDVVRAKAFFGALFGWTFGHEDGARYAHVGNTNLPFGLVRGDPLDLTNLYFRVAEIEQSVARVNELGGSADAPQRSDSGRTAVCRDDQSTSFSLWEPASGY